MSPESPFPPSSAVTRIELADHLASGDPLDLRELDKTGRTVLASLLREVLIDKDLPRDPRGLTVVGARIVGHLDLSYCTVPAPLRLSKADFQGVLTLVCATITGELDLTEATLNGKDETNNSMVADRMRVNGSAFLGTLKTGGAVRLAGATITGELNLTKAELTGEDSQGRALVADGLQVKGNAMLGELQVDKGAIRLADATITGVLVLTDAVLNGKDRDDNALVADRMHVNGSAFLSGLRAKGAVRLTGASITAELNLIAARLNGKDNQGNALVADGLQVNGNAMLGRLRVADGAVWLAGATITGQFNLIEATINRQDSKDNALVADGAQVSGGAFLNTLTANGAVRLTGATITGPLDLTGATLNGKDGKDNALAADRLQVTGDAVLRQLNVTPGAKISLQDGRLGNLVLDREAPGNGWPRNNFVGLRYDQIDGPPATSARQGARLLASQADGSRAAQPYWQLADYYARVGNDSASRRLRVWSNVLQARARARSWPRFIYGLTTGFGYYPFLTLLWLVLLIGLDAAAIDAHRSDFIPTSAPAVSVSAAPVSAAPVSAAPVSAAPVSAARDQGPVSSTRCDSRYPCFNPVLYATETVVPVISLGQQDAWRVDTSRAGLGLQTALFFTTASGWILTTLLVGGVGGLLRRT